MQNSRQDGWNNGCERFSLGLLLNRFHTMTENAVTSTFGLCALYLDKVAYCNYIGNTPFWSASTIPYHLILSAPIELIYFANYPFCLFVWLQTTDRRFWYAPLELIVCVKIATDGDSQHSDPTTTSLIISYHHPHCPLFVGIYRVMIHG